MKKTIFILFALGFILSACEDVIRVDIEEAEELFAVDAWLNNNEMTQTIRLSKTLPYFDNNFTPAVENAVVTVFRQDFTQFDFVHSANGVYEWTPGPGENLGVVGDSFLLSIQLEDKNYGALSTINRVPEIDSMRTFTREDEVGFVDGEYALFFARDPLGRGDTYWIKTFKNGQFLNKPNEINIAYDAGFDAGGNTDNLIFISPIREFIYPIEDPDEDPAPPPYVIGDTCRVEIHSISNEAFFFLETARDQLNNGSNGIFSLPLANTRGNIFEQNSDEVILGIFTVSAVSSSEVIFE